MSAAQADTKEISVECMINERANEKPLCVRAVCGWCAAGVGLCERVCDYIPPSPAASGSLLLSRALACAHVCSHV